MASDLSWSTRLNFLQFCRAVLFVEKWMTIVFITLLALSGVTAPALTCAVVVCSLLFYATWNNYWDLQETSDMPVNRITIKI